MSKLADRIDQNALRNLDWLTAIHLQSRTVLSREFLASSSSDRRYAPELRPGRGAERAKLRQCGDQLRGRIWPTKKD